MRIPTTNEEFKLENIQLINDAVAISVPVQLFADPSDSTVTYSRFESCTDTIPELITVSFNTLADRCSEPVIRDDKDGPAFCPATFAPAYRKSKNATNCHFLAFDLDNLPDHVTAEDVLECVAGFSAFTYSTHSHKMPGKGNRFRVVIAIHAPIPAAQYKKVATQFAGRFAKWAGAVDSAGFSPSQMLYFPSCPSDHREHFEFDGQEGEPFNWSVDMNNLRTGDFPTVIDTAQLVRDSQILISKGSRNKELFRIGAALRGCGLDDDQIAAQLLKKNDQLCVPPLEADEVLGIAKSISRYPQGNVVVPLDQSIGLLANNETAITELSLAREIAQVHSGQFHFVTETGKWMLLDSSTNVWKEDATGQVNRWALDQIQRRAKYAADLIGQGQYKYGQEILAGVRKAEKNGFINGTLSLLKSLEGIQVTKSEFDANPYVIGFQGGKCADLQALTIRDIFPTDKVTKLAGAEYHADARCPLWEKSVMDWACGDRELARFLQVWVGYTLSGLTEQQYFLFLFGGGRNGKSVFIDIINALLKDYAMTMNPESLMLKSGGGGANNDIARLAGARLVTSVELQEGRVFDENLIKQLTGGDKITARYLYRENFEFHPNLKLAVTGNHKPIVKGTDFGFWRRVLMVPFFANVDNPDAGLTQKLRGELPGILNWALEGWRIYQAEGLVIPKVVERESFAYREEMDIVGQWKQQCTAPMAGNEIRANVLYHSFRKWAEENGFFSMNSSAFGRKIASAGVRSRRDGRGVIYLDLQLVG